jgi:hypothetical protein
MAWGAVMSAPVAALAVSQRPRRTTRHATAERDRHLHRNRRSRTPARSRLVTALRACLTPARRSLPTRLDRLAATEACGWRGTVHGVPELSAHLTQRLIEVLDCTVTLRRRVEDRSTQVSVVVTSGWHPDHVEQADQELLARHVWGEPDEDRWLTRAGRRAARIALRPVRARCAEPGRRAQRPDPGDRRAAAPARRHPCCGRNPPTGSHPSTRWRRSAQL